MSVIDSSGVRSRRFGKRFVTTASTAALVSGGLILLSVPAYAAETGSCTAAQTNYQNALAQVSAGATLAGKLAAAHQAVAEAQQTRNELAAMATASAVQAQSGLDAAVVAAASKETDLDSAQEDLQRALASARWANDRVDSIQAELDALSGLRAAAEDKAQIGLKAAILARSDAAAKVVAAETALGAAIESRRRPAIDTAQATLLARRGDLGATETQVAEAERVLERLKADGDAHLADTLNRLESAEQLAWELGEHLAQADAQFRVADNEARVASDDVSRTEDALLRAQNVEGITEADGVLAAASAAATALQSQTTLPPEPASMDQLHRSAVEACRASDEATAQTAPVLAAPVAARMQTILFARRAPLGLALTGPGQPIQISSAPAPGRNVQTGSAAAPEQKTLPAQTGSAPAAAHEQNPQADTATVTAKRTSAVPYGQDGLVMAAWLIAGIFVLAVTTWSVRRVALKRR